MNTKHTPGPWSGIEGIAGADGRLVCEVMLDRPVQEFHANASLIAAAPELIDALIAITNESVCLKSEIVKQARTAIAKARGEV